MENWLRQRNESGTSYCTGKEGSVQRHVKEHRNRNAQKVTETTKREVYTSEIGKNNEWVHE